MMLEKMMPPRRPRWSATYAPESAPKNVPCERSQPSSSHLAASLAPRLILPPRYRDFPLLTMERNDVMSDLLVEEMQK